MRHNAKFNESGIVHTPVLGKEIIDYIGNSKFNGEGILVDCTCGEGGHSKLFLENFEALKIIANIQIQMELP